MKKIFAILIILSILVMNTETIFVKSQEIAEAGFYVSSEIADDLRSRVMDDEAILHQGYLLERYAGIVNELPECLDGGAYFDAEGKLHIQLVDECDNLPEYEDIVYENAKYSMNSLMSYQKSIMEIRDAFGIEASGIRQNINKIVFYGENIHDEEILNTIIPEDAYVTEKRNVINNDCSVHTVKPGKK